MLRSLPVILWAAKPEPVRLHMMERSVRPASMAAER